MPNCDRCQCEFGSPGIPIVGAEVICPRCRVQLRREWWNRFYSIATCIAAMFILLCVLWQEWRRTDPNGHDLEPPAPRLKRPLVSPEPTPGPAPSNQVMSAEF